VDDERIVEEWLCVVRGNRETTLYERSTDAQGQVEIGELGFKDASPKLQALVQIGGPQNQTFLATVHATLEREDVGPELTEVLDWIVHGLTLIGPETRLRSLGEYLATQRKFQEFAGVFLRSASTGVDHLKVDRPEISKEEYEALWPKALRPMMGAGRKSSLGTSVTRLPKGPELLIEHRKDGDHYFRLNIQAAHLSPSDPDAALELHEESDGTRRLLELIPALYRLKDNRAVYFIDEIDRSMHPMLVKKFIEYFLRVCTGAPCQIVVTTHESHLLDLDLLRRDEIWFAEKDTDGASNLYSLTDFKVRKDRDIEKGYFEGRFGAVPFLGDFDRLIERPDGEAECP
jgi:hypothetical protein